MLQRTIGLFLLAVLLVQPGCVRTYRPVLIEIQTRSDGDPAPGLIVRTSHTAGMPDWGLRSPEESRTDATGRTIVHVSSVHDGHTTIEIIEPGPDPEFDDVSVQSEDSTLRAWFESYAAGQELPTFRTMNRDGEELELYRFMREERGLTREEAYERFPYRVMIVAIGKRKMSEAADNP